VAGGADFIDLEYDLDHSTVDRVRSAAGDAGTRVIWSLHDFEGVPEDLGSILSRMVRSSDGVAKVAVTPKSTADLYRLLVVSDDSGPAERIVVGMGEFGTLTRVAPSRFGSMLTFCSVPGASAAPGHLTPQDLATIYRIGAQKRDWPLFAVVGNPVGHSRSPHYHNARFEAAGADALYVPILVDQFSELLSLAEALPLHGLSVTIPHKQAALYAASERSAEATAVGAANTLVRGQSGWVATNTDVIGFMAPLEELQSELTGLRALVLGAGGASRGVVYALARAGVSVLLHNRTHSRAEQLCAEFAGLPEADSLALPSPVQTEEITGDTQPVDIVVNTTSVGMHGDGDPASWYEFHGTEIVYDIVYTPPETPLIVRAAEAGCRVITGDRMFEAQAAAQFELFLTLTTGQRDGG
jgi:3-dehydroquinate dehydratase/shikimate dehydrogenase